MKDIPAILQIVLGLVFILWIIRPYHLVIVAVHDLNAGLHVQARRRWDPMDDHVFQKFDSWAAHLLLQYLFEILYVSLLGRLCGASSCRKSHMPIICQGINEICRQSRVQQATRNCCPRPALSGIAVNYHYILWVLMHALKHSVTAEEQDQQGGRVMIFPFE